MGGIKQKVATGIGLLIAASVGLGVGFSVGESTVLKEQRLAVAEPPRSSVISPNFPTAPKIPKYVLKSHEGKLAVFIGDKKQPEIVFDQFVHLLPDVDRRELERGIEVEDYEELLRLIEDYTS